MWDIFRSIGLIDNLKQKGSIKYYKEKLQEYQENEADVLIDLGILYYEDEKYEDSLDNLKKSASIYSSLGEEESEAFVQDLMGDVYLSMRKTDNALEKYQKAFELYSSAGSSMKSELLEKLKEVNNIKEAIELANENKMEIEIEKEDLPVLTKENGDLETDDFKESCPKKAVFNYYLSYEKISFKLEEIMEIIEKKYNVKEPSKVEYESGYFQKYLMEVQKKGYSEKEVALLQLLSYFFMKEGKLYSAMQNLKTAFNISHEVGDKEGEAFSLLLGVVYYLLSKEDKIYSVFKKSFSIFREIKYKKGETIALDIINILYNEDDSSDKDSCITA